MARRQKICRKSTTSLHAPSLCSAWPARSASSLCRDCPRVASTLASLSSSRHACAARKPCPASAPACRRTRHPPRLAPPDEDRSDTSERPRGRVPPAATPDAPAPHMYWTHHKNTALWRTRHVRPAYQHTCMAASASILSSFPLPSLPPSPSCLAQACLSAAMPARRPRPGGISSPQGAFSVLKMPFHI